MCMYVCVCRHEYFNNQGKKNIKLHSNTFYKLKILSLAVILEFINCIKMKKINMLGVIILQTNLKLPKKNCQYYYKYDFFYFFF